MTAWLGALLLLAGAGFVLVAAIGVLRFPDALCRMHAATKAGAFGVALMLGAAALHFGEAATAIKALLMVTFFYLTAPIAGHLLGRAAHGRNRGEMRLDTDEWSGS